MARKPRILIADDDPKLLAALEVRLMKLNVDVITATDGYSALAKANEEKPDLMILDVNMPAGDGFSVQERMGRPRQAGGLPVIYMTGDRSERLDEIAEDFGAYALFHKPIRMSVLVDAVYNALQPQMAA